MKRVKMRRTKKKIRKRLAHGYRSESVHKRQQSIKEAHREQVREIKI